GSALPQLAHAAMKLGRLRGERQAAGLGAPPPQLHLGLPRLQRAPPDRDTQRTAEQLRLGELLARAGVAVVVEDVDTAAAQRLVQLLAGGALARALGADRAEMHTARRVRVRPDDGGPAGAQSS